MITSTTTSGLSGPGSNGNEGILHTLQPSRTGAYQMQFSVIPMRHISFLEGSLIPLHEI